MAAHRYWRLYATNHWGSGAVGATELQYRNADGGTNLAITPGGTVTSTATYEGSAVDMFDGDTTTNGTGWQGNTTPAWVATDFGGSPQDINHLTIYNWTNSTYNFRSGSLQWSDDGSVWVAHITFADNPSAEDGVYEYVYTPPDTGTAELIAPSGTVSCYSGVSVALTPPLANCASFGGATVNLISPAVKLVSFTGAAVTISPPRTTLICVGRDSTGEQAANLTAPSPSLTIRTGANSRNTGPKQTLVTSGTVTRLASAALFAPEPTLSASGTTTVLGSATLTGPIQRLVGYSGAVCSVSITGTATLTATGVTGAVGGAQLTAPLFELTASATSQNRGSALLSAPSPKLGGQARGFLIAPGATLTAIGSAVVTATYEAYALNLNHTPRGGEQPVDELTHFTNYPFTHVVRYQNSYFGANSTGLYLLEGTTDDGVPIPWEVQTAMTDFETAQKKTVEMAYFGGRFGPASTVSLYVGEVGPTAYSYATPRDTSAQNYRQAFGRGLKSRYYALGAEGTGELTIDSITLNVAVTARKV